MTDVSHAPARASAAAALAAGVASLAASAVVAPTAAAVAAVGLALLAAGVVRGSRRAVTVGALALFAGAVVSGVRGAPPVPLLVAVTTSVFAWDVGENAIGVGEQLGREASTWRAEAVHAAVSLTVGALAVGLGYGVYAVAGGGRPLAALVFLLVAAVVLTSVLRS